MENENDSGDAVGLGSNRNHKSHPYTKEIMVIGMSMKIFCEDSPVRNKSTSTVSFSKFLFALVYYNKFFQYVHQLFKHKTMEE